MGGTVTIHDDVSKALGLAPPELPKFTGHEWSAVEILEDYFAWSEWYTALRAYLPDVVAIKFMYDVDCSEVDWTCTRLKYVDGSVGWASDLAEEVQEALCELTTPTRRLLQMGLDLRVNPLTYVGERLLLDIDSIRAKVHSQFPLGEV